MNSKCLSGWSQIIAKISACCLVAAGLWSGTSGLRASTIIWNGANIATDTNWSDNLNWIGNVAPGNADDVKFYDTGSSTYSNINNIVNANTTIGSLQYGNTNNSHTTLIANGVTLNITNTGGLIVATPADPAAAKLITNTIVGPQGTLSISNVSATISVNQGGATSGSREIFNLTGLSMLNANISRIGVGTTTSFNPGSAANKVAGVLYLAETNVLFLSLTDTLANYQTIGSRTNAIEISKNPSNNGGIASYLFLGQSNMLFLDSIGIGRDKNNGSSTWGWMGFNPAFTNNHPIAYFRGVNGPASRVTWWCVGDGAASGSSSNGGVGTNDFSYGSVDALINVLSVARDASAADAWAGPHRGWLTFTAGTIDANTVILGNQSLESSGSSTACFGQINVLSTALLRVNTLLTLGFTALTSASSAALNTSGILNVNGGTVLANTIAVGTSSSVNKIILSNATMVVTNTLATNATGLASLALTNSTLGLTLPGDGSLRSLVNVFTTGGATNLIQLDTTPVLFASYPQQFPLIKYTSWSGPNNFGLVNIPGWAPGANLVSNGFNHSLDILIPTNPLPIITSQPASFGGSPGSTVSLSVTNTGVSPLSYQWYFENNSVTNALSDGPGESGSSTLAGSLTSSLVINNGQIGDSGGYFVIITNAYGAVTSSVAQVFISPNPIAPIETGPFNQTIVAGNTATISATASGNPLPALQWQFNGVNLADGPGANGEIFAGGQTSSLNITNVQYPYDQGTYSFVSTNIAGAKTNSMVLTVIVSPGITNQPVSAVVTNSQAASFSVLAGGVPAPSYQWFFNGSPIALSANATANSATLSFAHAAPTNTGSYYVQVSNAAGTTNSAAVNLTVNSTMSYTSLSPANSATGVCYDTPLYITFTQTPTLLTLGKIRIYNITNATTPVDTIDLTQCVTNFPVLAVDVQGYLIGGQLLTNFPVIINGNTAAIYPHHDLLTSNQTYYVTLDDATFADSTGAYFAGISATNAWEFTTKVGGPLNPTNLVVAQDGTGDFLTLQGAVDGVPANNTTPTIINIHNGVYEELMNVNSKNNLDFRGQSRNGTVIGYPNNNNVYGGAPQRASFILNGNDCTFETMTVTNMTPSGGGQAEAMDVEGTRAIFLNIELDSFQDTFLVHSAGKLVYFQDSLITGQTDFNWGYGSVYYTNCEIRCTLSGGHVTQPRSPFTTNGFGFINCRITKGYTGSATFDLGRTISTPTSPSEVLFAGCLMDSTVVTGYSSDAGTNMADYSCSNLTATAPIVLANSTHSTASDPYVIAIQSAFTWLGWQPLASPNLTNQPVNQSVSFGQAATFSAAATGIPAPTYQWLRNGNPIANATNSSYTVSSAVRTNGGSYSVVVNNGSGSMTSSAAALTYVDTAPVAPSFSIGALLGIPETVKVIGGQHTPTDVDGDALTITGVSGAANGTPTTDGSNVTYTASSGISDSFIYTVNDGFGSTANGTISVVINTNVALYNQLGAAVMGSGTNVITFLGNPNYNYALDLATNLNPPLNWMPQATNPAGINGTLNFTNVSTQTPSFYRTRSVP